MHFIEVHFLFIAAAIYTSSSYKDFTRISAIFFVIFLSLSSSPYGLRHKPSVYEIALDEKQLYKY